MCSIFSSLYVSDLFCLNLPFPFLAGCFLSAWGSSITWLNCLVFDHAVCHFPANFHFFSRGQTIVVISLLTLCTNFYSSIFCKDFISNCVLYFFSFFVLFRSLVTIAGILVLFLIVGVHVLVSVILNHTVWSAVFQCFGISSLLYYFFCNLTI